MARTARLVVPGLPHHVTQRGNRRQRTFFSDRDYRLYLDLLTEWSTLHALEVWAYCLMPNHTHLVCVPTTSGGLAATMAQVHRRYTRHINARQGWTGHLWQARYASFVMDEQHLLNCVRYVELNPVRAGLCETAGDWPWSSVRAHLSGRNDGICRVAPIQTLVGDWSDFLTAGSGDDELTALRACQVGNWPLGAEAFVSALEARTGRRLRPGKPGPRPGLGWNPAPASQ